MKKIATFALIILALSALAIGFYGLPQAHVPRHLQHDMTLAHGLFIKNCTRCHPAQQALTRRAYQDWLVGITIRHGEARGWIPEEEAIEIFHHLVVQLEADFAIMVEEDSFPVTSSWQKKFSFYSGILSILLIATTFLFGHSQTLRTRWFMGHKFFAISTLCFAIIHGGFNLFVTFFR